MLNINISIVSNYGLKLKPQNYTPKGTVAHSVEKQERSGLDAHLCVTIQFCPIKTKTWITTDDFMLSEEWRRSKLGLPTFKRDKVILLSLFLLDSFAFMQKQLRMWKARRWNVLALAVSKFCRGSVKVYIFLYKLYKYYMCKKRNLILYILIQNQIMLSLLIDDSVGWFY